MVAPPREAEPGGPAPAGSASAAGSVSAVREGRCTHARLEESSCQACEDACREDAIFPAGPEIFIFAEACTGCGACVAACPQEALALAPSPPEVLIPLGAAGPAVAMCREWPGAARAAVARCIHALSDAALAAGPHRIAVATPDCAACPLCPPETLFDRVARLNALAADRGRAGIELRPATPAEARAALDERAAVDPARRRLFARFATAGEVAAPAEPAAALRELQALPGAAPRFRHVPRIDPALCIGCDACLRICPEEVLALDSEGGVLRYTVAAERCTGCALCVDICAPAAMRVEPMAQAAAPIPLHDFRCRMCGVSVHEPVTAATEAAPDLCRICRAAPHGKRLHQVIA
ncbi:4Fe-4S binding protein [Paracoccus sanguinis]|uniref:4Fe-4S binding protein n=1 Tax=Paracoccus sanguinis TaxID=1545044 RepID=UPI0009DF26EA|nr:4Fe-4S binding protein [Paracoccus sanguinis]